MRKKDRREPGITNWENPEADPLEADPSEDRLEGDAIFDEAGVCAPSRATDSPTARNNAMKMDNQTEGFTAGPPGKLRSAFHPEYSAASQGRKHFVARVRFGENSACAPSFLCPAKYRILRLYPTDFFVNSSRFAISLLSGQSRYSSVLRPGVPRRREFRRVRQPRKSELLQ
jgi:hypothetical protein